jgi:MarR family transcriptional regulator, transcriptional regulator for hemolysin
MRRHSDHLLTDLVLDSTVMSDPATDRRARDLTGMLNRAGHMLTGRLSSALAEVGLTPRTQCVLVHALERDRTQAELAALADLDKTTMVATADALEQLGYARRVPSAADRRARIIEVTEAGRMAAEAGERIVDRVHAEVLSELEEQDRHAFMDALAHLSEGEAVAAGQPPNSVRRRRQPTTDQK